MPTATAQPLPTATRAPATPVATQTLTSTAGSLPPDPVIAFAKTQAAHALRFDFTWRVALTETAQSLTQDIQGEGQANGPAEHLTFTGPSPITRKPVTFEMFHNGDQVFVKGLALGPGTDLNVWYEFPAQMGNLQKSAPNPRDLLSQLSTQDLTQGNFQLRGRETVDAQACQVWTTDDPALAAQLTNTLSIDLQSALATTSGFELSVWTCEDGYLHQFQAQIEGHDPHSTEVKARVEFTDHFYDFDSTDIVLTPPADAQPMPGLGPVPTAQP